MLYIGWFRWVILPSPSGDDMATVFWLPDLALSGTA